ncbi:MAG: small acid-soluble spore protein alpha/beta type [Massilibacillus sp.]|jgi:hypothetical protein|nr:small acid-soluble spore protein alpha/beta type [Massilibacillus sp.]
MSRTNKLVNPAAQNSMDKMKYEIASELGIADAVRQNGWSTMTSADCGRVGGRMVRKMIEQYESSLGNNSQQ